jgi:hypothetical protein
LPWKSKISGTVSPGPPMDKLEAYRFFSIELRNNGRLRRHQSCPLESVEQSCTADMICC